MTTKQLDALNRKNSIIKRLRAGDTCRSIATDEGVVMQYVYKVGSRERLRVRGAIGSQEAQISWQRINTALNLWNAAHGRAKAPRREA